MSKKLTATAPSVVGNYRRGDWTKEAIEERRWLRTQWDMGRLIRGDPHFRDAVCQGVGLAGPHAGDHEERQPRRAVLLPDPVLDGPPLRRQAIIGNVRSG